VKDMSHRFGRHYLDNSQFPLTFYPVSDIA